MALDLGVLIGLGIKDEKAKISATDTTTDYLEEKIVAGSNITINVLNSGGDEQLEIVAAAGGTPSIGGTITSGTDNAVLFVNPAATFDEDPTNFSYEKTGGILRLGANATIGGDRLEITGSASTIATLAIKVDNSSGNDLFQLYDSGDFEIGRGATIGGNANSLALGVSANASAGNCIAIGINSDSSSGASCTAIGNGATTSGSSSTAIGVSASSGGNNVAIGNSATAGQTSDVAIGDSSDTSGSGSGFAVAIGFQATVNGTSGVAIGRNTVADETDSSAIGLRSEAYGNGDTSIGSYAGNRSNTTQPAASAYNVCLGSDVWLSAANLNQAIAIGSSVSAGADHAFVIGSGTLSGNAIDNDESNTLLLGWNSTSPSFRWTKNSNFVLRSDSAITATTHYDTTGTNVITIHNGTETSGSITDAIQIYAKDATAGGANSTLSLYCEQAVEAIGTFTPSHKLAVWINGTEYHIQLDAV